MSTTFFYCPISKNSLVNWKQKMIMSQSKQLVFHQYLLWLCSQLQSSPEATVCWLNRGVWPSRTGPTAQTTNTDSSVGITLSSPSPVAKEKTKSHKFDNVSPTIHWFPEHCMALFALEAELRFSQIWGIKCLILTCEIKGWILMHVLINKYKMLN